MMSATLRHILLCVVVLGSLGLVQGRRLPANLMKQTDALKHGLDLATKVGDIASHRNDVAFTVVPSSSSTYRSGTTIAFKNSQDHAITATLSTEATTALPPLPRVCTSSLGALLSPITILGIPSYWLMAAHSTSFIARKPTKSAGLPLQSGSVKTARSGWHQRITVSTCTARIPRFLDGRFTRLVANAGIESIS